MEFDFIRDRDGQCSLELNGEQPALERWFNNKARQSIATLDDLLKIITAIKEGRQREYLSSDTEFQMTLDAENCLIFANWLAEPNFEDTLNEGYDSASLEEQYLTMDEDNAKAECGLDDFAYLLEEWRAFLLENQS